MSDPEWLSVSEAARRLGISRSAIQNRVKRRTLETMTDNHGRPLVKVAVPAGATVLPASLHNVADAMVARQAVEAPQKPQSPPSGMISLDDVRIMLSEQREYHDAAMVALWDHARADRDADRQHHADELARQDARHLAELTRLERAYQSAADALMAKVSAVLVASRPRRSWWRW